jgi:hypothetical protein
MHHMTRRMGSGRAYARREDHQGGVVEEVSVELGWEGRLLVLAMLVLAVDMADVVLGVPGIAQWSARAPGKAASAANCVFIWSQDM